MKLHIQRDRWILIRNKKEIFCGLARNYTFKPIHDIGDTAIKTYLSKNKAESSFISSWTNGEELLKKGSVVAVNVVEEIATREFYKGDKDFVLDSAIKMKFADKDHEITVLERALWIASVEVEDDNQPYIELEPKEQRIKGWFDYFKQQAEKEIDG